MTTSRVLHLVTGEYPPAPGGVGDYSALLAAGLARAGAAVHVWTGPTEGRDADVPGVTVHRVAGVWSPDGLTRLDEELGAFPPPRRLVVQYVPNAYGYKGLNIGFCRWLLGRRTVGDRVRVMFHEVAYPFELLGKPTRWILALGNRLMARTLVSAADEIDVAIPGWERMLRAYVPGDRRPFGVRPVPSNVPVIDDPVGVAGVRARVAPVGGTVIGSFGSFSDRVARLLAVTLPALLRGRPDRVGLLIGRKGDRMAAGLSAAHPDLAGRLVATGGLSAGEASRHLQACDILVQPYPDGISGRRGSAMAGLAHGVAMVTNAGHLTEPFWAGSGAVALAASPAVPGLITAAETLLADSDVRERVGLAARVLHQERFAVERTVEAILSAEVGPA